MAARPPQSDDEPREPAVFGIAAVDDYLSAADISYPATPEDVSTALDDPDVACGPNAHDIALSTVLDRTGRVRFDSRRDLLDELHDAFEQERRTGGGVVAWLRSLVS
ncbi:hypothetical protein [Halobacterium zhouii]|uniref:hypothetical protein n=1 Tax=Halobacterium zhouii TaxID=2902624 RepID=UPI001E53E65D|nr:hypothetical protein [Halobacterium zhouii]